MENKPIAVVKSPSKAAFLREGQGFSLEEIQQAKKDIITLKKLGVRIDYFRKSAHASNIELLKALKLPEKKGKKKKPFVMKEKKLKVKKEKVKGAKKPKVAPKKEEAVEEELKGAKKTAAIEAKKAKEAPKETGKLLTELSGLGATTAKKFNEIGVETVEQLCKENPKELSALLKGVSEEKIQKWIEEGKELIKK